MGEAEVNSKASNVLYTLLGELSVAGALTEAQVEQFISEGKAFRTTVAKLGETGQMAPLGALPQFSHCFAPTPAPAQDAPRAPGPSAQTAANSVVPPPAPPPIAVVSGAVSVGEGAAFHYASFWRRVGAILIDYALLILPCGGIALLLLFVFKLAPGELGFTLIQNIFALSVTAGYFGYFLSRDWQATPGKKWLGLRVLRLDGVPIDPSFAVLRFFAYFLDSLTLGIGFLMPLWTKRKQALHDKACRTVVVHVQSAADFTAVRKPAPPMASAVRWAAIAACSAAYIGFNVIVVKLQPGGGNALYQCNSDTVTRALSKLVKDNANLEITRYVAFKTLSNSITDGAACWTDIVMNNGAAGELWYRVYIDPNDNNIMVRITESKDKPEADAGAGAASPPSATAPDADRAECKAQNDAQDFKAGLAACDRALASQQWSARDRAAILVLRGGAHYRLGEYDQALADDREATRLDPSNADAVGDVGNVYYDKGDYQQAIAIYTSSLRIAQDATAYSNRGCAYVMTGALNSAEADFAAARRLGYADAGAPCREEYNKLQRKRKKR